MKMGARRHTLESAQVADFVKQAYKHVAEQPPRPSEQRRALTGELNLALSQAREQQNTPLENALKELRGALNNLNLGKGLYPKLLKQLEAARERLSQPDFLGDIRPRLPEAFDKALKFLKDKSQLGTASKPPQGAGASRTSSPGSARAKGAAQGAQGETSGPVPRTSGLTHSVEAFVHRYRQDGFEQQGAGVSEQEQRLFEGLDSTEQELFRSLQPGERSQYLKMPPRQKELVRQLDAQERGTFMALHPEQRDRLLQQPDPRALLSGQMRSLLEGLGTREPTELARSLGRDLVGLLGEREGAPGQEKLLEEATTLVSNYLEETGGNLAAAKTKALQSLLDSPRFSQKLLGALEATLAQRQEELGKGNLYVSHFKKIRSTIPEFAKKLAHSSLSREELVGGLSEAIEVSAEFQAKNPPRRRHLRAAQHHAFEGRHISG